jgi:hypothetical protein
MKQLGRPLSVSVTAIGLIALCALLPRVVVADDTSSPCAVLKHIIAAAPGGFAGLSPDDGKAVAQTYGDDAQCTVSAGSYRCLWTQRKDAASSADVLQTVAADVAACLPDATHDQNSPSSQHFYVGARGSRTNIVATTAGGNRLQLTVSGK